MSTGPDVSKHRKPARSAKELREEAKQEVKEAKRKARRGSKTAARGQTARPRGRHPRPVRHGQPPPTRARASFPEIA